MSKILIERSAIEALRSTLNASTMAHHSGGDSAMIFDAEDREVEARRHGWYSVDDKGVDKLRSDIDAMLAKTDHKDLLVELSQLIEQSGAGSSHVILRDKNGRAMKLVLVATSDIDGIVHAVDTFLNV